MKILKLLIAVFGLLAMAAADPFGGQTQPELDYLHRKQYNSDQCLNLSNTCRSKGGLSACPTKKFRYGVCKDYCQGLKGSACTKAKLLCLKDYLHNCYFK